MRRTGIKAGLAKRGARECRRTGRALASLPWLLFLAKETGGMFARYSGRLPILRAVRTLPILLILACLSAPWPAMARDRSIEAFFGTYEGTSISPPAEGMSTRDMKVSIAPTRRGFNVTWDTITRRADGQSKVKTYSIDFEPTGREDIFGSEMRLNKFGDRVPLDPLKGVPYVWARITGNTLTVYALHITADGSYDMQVYNRTLTEQGMSVKYSRFSEGEPMRVVTGTLAKVDR
jgi:hypothetical protein